MSKFIIKTSTELSNNLSAVYRWLIKHNRSLLNEVFFPITAASDEHLINFIKSNKLSKLQRRSALRKLKLHGYSHEKLFSLGVIKQHKHNWTKAEIFKEAKKYKSRRAWQLNNKKSYKAALIRGIYEKCCEHMKDTPTIRKYKNQILLLKMAKNGEEKPSFNKERDNKLLYALQDYIKDDIQFKGKLREIRPDWLISRNKKLMYEAQNNFLNLMPKDVSFYNKNQIWKNIRCKYKMKHKILGVYTLGAQSLMKAWKKGYSGHPIETKNRLLIALKKPRKLGKSALDSSPSLTNEVPIPYPKASSV